MTTEEINRIEEIISFHGNNCGGCETCDQVFGSELLTFDAETVWGLVQTIRSMEAKLRLADEMVDHILTSESRNPELSLAEAYHNIGKREPK